MGLFTSIRHPATGAEIQIKTGFDDCFWHSVGDKIRWSPQEGWPGCHIDGAYNGFMESDGDAWVVIQDCTVLAVLDTKDIDNKDLCIEAYLCSFYGIKAPDPTLWSDAAWGRHKERQEAHKKKWEAIEKAADDKGLSGNARFAFFLVQPLLPRQDFGAIGRKVFEVKPITKTEVGGG